jgi:DNA modification methylase
MPSTKIARSSSKFCPPKDTNAGLTDLQIEYRNVVDLVLDSRNPRQHSQQQISQISDSIREFGFCSPVAIDHAGHVVMGHARVLAARKLGMQRIPVIELKHLSKGQLKALRIADNKLAQGSHWDERLLAENFLELKELKVDFDLSITGYTLPEIDLAVLKLHESGKVKADDDRVDATTGVGVCEAGQIWLLGHHRLVCGDATSENAFDLLMEEERADLVFTDPPYNVPVAGHVSGKGKVRHREFAQGVGELNREEFVEFLTKSCGLLAKHSRDGAVNFVCMDWAHSGELLQAGHTVYSELKNIAVWVKSNAGMGSLYRSQHEFVFVFKAGSAPHTNNIQLGKHGRNRSNVWKYDSASVQARKGNNLLALHPTAKPVDLVMDALLDCSRRGDIVLDSFVGSGTTLLAAERTGRIFRGIELDPLYVDTAVRRWQNLTGHDAVRASDGKPFREIEAEGAGR